MDEKFKKRRLFQSLSNKCSDETRFIINLLQVPYCMYIVIRVLIRMQDLSIVATVNLGTRYCRVPKSHLL